MQLRLNGDTSKTISISNINRQYSQMIPGSTKSEEYDPETYIFISINDANDSVFENCKGFFLNEITQMDVLDDAGNIISALPGGTLETVNQMINNDQSTVTINIKSL